MRGFERGHKSVLVPSGFHVVQNGHQDRDPGGYTPLLTPSFHCRWARSFRL
jgi:hypothetical protein